VKRLGKQAAGLMLLLVLMPVMALAQATQPVVPANHATDQAADQLTEQQPLRISESDIHTVTARAATPGTKVSNYSDLSRIGIALLIVIGIILLLRAAFRQMTSLPGGGRGSKMVTVLSRSSVSPRQQVLVLQVGKRLLVVGDSGGRMHSLCEISDPDEIAMMIGQTRSAREAIAERNPASFMNLFRRASEPFSETEALALGPDDSAKQIDPNEGVSSEEMNGLMDKVRMLQEQFRVKT
jgi:flagellar biogenesis protein FliO